jgi:hypothetical protein
MKFGRDCSRSCTCGTRIGGSDAHRDHRRGRFRTDMRSRTRRARPRSDDSRKGFFTAHDFRRRGSSLVSVSHRAGRSREQIGDRYSRRARTIDLSARDLSRLPNHIRIRGVFLCVVTLRNNIPSWADAKRPTDPSSTFCASPSERKISARRVGKTPHATLLLSRESVCKPTSARDMRQEPTAHEEQHWNWPQRSYRAFR